MKANKKFRDEEEAVSAVIGVILMVAITVAIAATVYLYVTGMIGTGTTESENASVVVKGENNQIRATLSKAGANMPTDGYIEADWTIFVNGTEVKNPGLGAWDVGDSWIVQWDSGNNPDRYNYTASSQADLIVFTAGTKHAVTVTVKDTVVFDATVTIT